MLKSSGKAEKYPGDPGDEGGGHCRAVTHLVVDAAPDDGVSCTARAIQCASYGDAGCDHAGLLRAHSKLKCSRPAETIEGLLVSFLPGRQRRVELGGVMIKSLRLANVEAGHKAQIVHSMAAPAPYGHPAVPQSPAVHPECVSP